MLKRFLNKFIYLLNLVVAVFFVLSFIIPYVPLKIFPILAVVSLGIPLLFIVNIFFCIYWIFKAKKHFVISLSLIVIGLLVFDSFYQIEPKTELVPSHSIDIMTYNTRLFNKYDWMDDENIPDEIIHFINEQHPEVLCLQEFDMDYKDAFEEYPYQVFSKEDNNKSIQAIFSKYPIKDFKVLDFESSNNAALYADLQVANYTLRVFNVHLQSLGVSDPNAISNQEPKRLLKRMSSMFSKQEEQAALIRSEIDASSHFNIVTGDFNNTQFSRVYRLIKGKMNDSFIERGSGFGRSFDFKLFPMRIDFILTDDRLEVVDHQNFDVSFSDHYPISSTLSL